MIATDTRKILRLLLVVALALGSAVLGADEASLSVEAGSGPRPQLPPPRPSLVPTVHVASAKGWPEAMAPRAAAGTHVNAFAGALDHRGARGRSCRRSAFRPLATRALSAVRRTGRGLRRRSRCHDLPDGPSRRRREFRRVAEAKQDLGHIPASECESDPGPKARRFPKPLFHGDTIRVETEVVELRESRSHQVRSVASSPEDGRAPD